jgi:hypothetical protein
VHLPELLDPMPAQRIDKVLGDQTVGPRYYNRPSFSDQNRVFTDLVAYALACAAVMRTCWR